MPEDKYSKHIMVGGLWGLVSAILFFLLPEVFNIYWTGGSSGLLPDLVVTVVLLPVYIVSWVWMALIPATIDPWAILYIAPIWVILSIIVGAMIGLAVEKILQK